MSSAVTFDDARAITRAELGGRDVARYGWEDAEAWLVAVAVADDPADEAVELVLPGDPFLLVDKRTGAVERSYDVPRFVAMREVGPWPA